MNYTKIFIALIAVVSFSVAQSDTAASSKKYNSPPPKYVVAVESSKTLNKALLTSKPKTTWTKIKDLFM